jgi:flagellar biosynthesis protein FlhF
MVPRGVFPLQTRTYFASSIPAALEAARRDLGPEAALVGSRLAPPDMRNFGKLEVTFQVEGAAPTARFSPRVADPGLNQIREELFALRQAIGLTSAATQNTESLMQSAGSEPTGELPLAAFGPVPAAGCRRLAFVGPPGRGKTTSLVKVALRFGLGAKIPVRIYSAGAHGIGGQEQLARYAAILGVPFQAFETLESLHLALDGDGWRGLALIDTPGLSPREVLEMGSFSRFFARRKDIETHLVLRADASSADSLNMIERFNCLGVQRLLFTGLDEVSNLSAVETALMRSGIPATFAGTGPEIPEGLEEVTEEMIRKSARREARAAAATA